MFSGSAREAIKQMAEPGDESSGTGGEPSARGRESFLQNQNTPEDPFDLVTDHGLAVLATAYEGYEARRRAQTHGHTEVIELLGKTGLLDPEVSDKALKTWLSAISTVTELSFAETRSALQDLGSNIERLTSIQQFCYAWQFILPRSGAHRFFETTLVSEVAGEELIAIVLLVGQRCKMDRERTYNPLEDIEVMARLNR